MIDVTISIIKFERFVTFMADMIDFLFATKNRILDTDVVVQTVSTKAWSTDLSDWILEMLAVFNSRQTFSWFQEETYLAKVEKISWRDLELWR